MGFWAEGVAGKAGNQIGRLAEGSAVVVTGVFRW